MLAEGGARVHTINVDKKSLKLSSKLATPIAQIGAMAWIGENGIVADEDRSPMALATYRVQEEKMGQQGLRLSGITIGCIRQNQNASWDRTIACHRCGPLT